MSPEAHKAIDLLLSLPQSEFLRVMGFAFAANLQTHDDCDFFLCTLNLPAVDGSDLQMTLVVSLDEDDRAPLERFAAERQERVEPDVIIGEGSTGVETASEILKKRGGRL